MHYFYLAGAQSTGCFIQQNRLLPRGTRILRNFWILIFRSSLHNSPWNEQSSENKRGLGDQQSLSFLFCSVSAPVTGTSRSPLRFYEISTEPPVETEAAPPSRGQPAVTSTVPVSARNPICFPISHPQQRQALDCPGFPKTGVPRSGRKHGWSLGLRRGARHSSVL